MDLVTPVNIFVMAACMGSFMWGAARHFRQIGGVPPMMSVVSLLSVLAFLWLAGRVALGHRSPWWEASIVTEAAAAWLFWWAIRATATHRLSLAFSNDLPIRLLTSGPYRYVRHPFYASYIAFWIAGAANVTGLRSWLIPLVATAIYYFAALQEEAKFARSELAQDYLDYRAVTGLILPKMLSSPRSQANQVP